MILMGINVEALFKKDETMRDASQLWPEPDATIYFARLYREAIIPSKWDEDAGYDIYGCWADENIVIQPHETLLLPAGIASAFPSSYVMILKERGSTGCIGISQRSGVIDSGYRGEWMVPVTNLNTKPLVITKEQNPETREIMSEDYIVYPYSKAICQAILLEVPTSFTKEIPYDQLQAIPSKRQARGFGSSGK
jgi:dUTP pyrophosphatase